MADLIDRQKVLDCLYACFEEVNYGENAEAINLLGYALQHIEQMPNIDVENISDGYHSFTDLYEQRMILSAALAKNNPHAWKSKLHEDGSHPFGGGWFIMGFDTPDGEYTYHYELKDWDLFDCKEIPRGKPWDGHTSKDVRRLLSLPTVEPKRGEWVETNDDWIKCSLCGKEICYDANFCPNCGADMRGEKDD